MGPVAYPARPDACALLARRSEETLAERSIASKSVLCQTRAVEGSPSPSPARGGMPRWTVALVAVLLLAGGILAVVLLTGTEDSQAQTVRFQKPTARGEDPFTPPADVQRKARVSVDTGPFGGSGSNLVCDRDKLIRFLLANPDRMRAWADAVGISESRRDVVRFIRRLRPVTLTRDTRVTNHTYAGGRAVPFQAILQAGTAVLVDEKGDYVARCRCGNPLREAVFIPEAECLACPASYAPPPPCVRCYKRYPRPPRVGTPQDYGLPSTPEPRPEPEPTPQPEPTPAPEPRGLQCDPPRSQLEFERCAARRGQPPGQGGQSTTPQDNGPAGASWQPPGGTLSDRFTLAVSLFAPNTALDVALERPDGVVEHYAIQTDERGNGSRTFTPGSNDQAGVYSATITGGGETAQTSVSVSP
jgi:hypothetical protein